MDSVLTELTAAFTQISVEAQYKIFCAFIAVPFAVAAIEGVYNVFRGEKTTFAFKFFAVACFTAAVLVASFEYDVRAEIFSSITSVVLYAALLFYVCFLLYGLLCVINCVLVYAPPKKPREKSAATKTPKPSVTGETVGAKGGIPLESENYGSFGADGTFCGYLNVKYVKYLLDKLKKCDICAAERKEAEDLEVYLMNFAYRQPNESEREELSPKLNALIRALAKYNAV